MSHCFGFSTGPVSGGAGGPTIPGASTMQFTPADIDTLTQLLRWRRDVRQFRTGPVDPAAMAAIEAALEHAPSVGNSRPWRVVRVADPEMRASVIANFEAENARAAADYAGATRHAYRRLKLAGLREAPVHWAVFTDTAPIEGRGLGRQTMPETLAYSTVTAIHTAWLMARAHNVGMGWVSILDPEALTAMLDVPASWQLTGYLCIGYAAEEHDVPELERRGWQAHSASVFVER